ALTFFEERSRLGKELHAAYPQNVAFKNGLAISYSKLGWFYRDKMNDVAKAKPYFQQCHDIWKELAEQYPAYQEFRDNYEWVKEQLGY
ncbi:MAG TPA: NB-ARC domain-containing protein, partial [Saprospiraceae bacterium]|nr:NB-ARC domain-containing protein [Saprospiraceae bacterium]HMQ81580.1 NB-ARC domain-containing protein [Saprospiraceae bacterium]